MNHKKTSANFYNDKVEVISVLKSSQSWDGAELPQYPEGQPEIQILKITIPAGMRLPMHYHPVINSGVLIEGHLKITSKDGKTKEVKAGDAFNEMVDAYHYGENMGDKPTILYVFYVNVKDGKPLTVLADDSK